MEIPTGSMVLHHDLANQLQGLQESSGFNTMGSFLEHLFALEEQSRSQQCLSALFEQPWLENYSPAQAGVNPETARPPPPRTASVGVQVRLCCPGPVDDGREEAAPPIEETAAPAASYAGDDEGGEPDGGEEEEEEEDHAAQDSAGDSDAETESRLEFGGADDDDNDYSGKEVVVPVSIAYMAEVSDHGVPMAPVRDALAVVGAPVGEFGEPGPSRQVPPPPSRRPRRSYAGKHPGYTCEDCGAKFKHRMHYVNHMQEHRGIKTPTGCPYCPRTLPNLWRLRLHISAKHPQHAPPPRDKLPDEPILCHICGVATRSRHAYTNHLRTHTDERPYSCPTCDRTFKYQSALQYHVRTHTQERLYECHLCDKKYRYESNLAKHQLFHTGEKPFSCPHCGKRFTAKPSMKEHVHKQHEHPGIKPYTCPVCKKKYSRKFNMNTHIKKKHLHPKPGRTQGSAGGRRRSSALENVGMTNVVSKGFHGATPDEKPSIMPKLVTVPPLGKGVPPSSPALVSPAAQLALPARAPAGPQLSPGKVDVEVVNRRSRRHKQAEIELAEVMAGMVSS